MCRLCSVSGHEQQLLDFIFSKLPSNCCHEFDNLGNLIVKKNSANSANSANSNYKKILIISPIDEVGLLIKSIEPDGVLKFLNIGDIAPCALVGSVVEINGFCGVIGTIPPHLQSDSEKNSIPSIENMFIDLGALNQKQAEAKVNLGDVATFKPNFVRFGENRISSKSINSKIGCAIQLWLLQNLNECEFYCAFLTKSKVSSAGAATIANLVKPDIAIILNSFEEQLENKKSNFKLTLNPATNKTIFYSATKIANQNNMVFEFEAANYVHKMEQLIMQTQTGVKTLNLSVPCRLINSQCSNLSLNHTLQTLAFLENLIPTLTKK